MPARLSARTEQLGARVLMTLVAIGKLRGRTIDYAGGLGILVRALRDAGIEAHWTDKYCENAVARGFEADNEVQSRVGFRNTASSELKRSCFSCYLSGL